MVGSGQADCQKASPRYSRSSQRLHWTAVNQKMMPEHCRESQLDQRGGDETGRGVVAHLSPGIEHRRKQGADCHHDAGDGEEKGSLAHGNFRTHPPAQQPERRQQGGQKQDVAVEFEDGAEGRRRKADDRDESGCQHSGAPGGLHMLPQGRETKECPRVEDGEVQKIASK